MDNVTLDELSPVPSGTDQEILIRAFQIYLNWARNVPEIMERARQIQKEKEEGV